jgi:hypothetical protein
MALSELKIAGMKLMIEGGAQFTADLNTAKTTSKMLTSELKLLEASTTSAGKKGVAYLTQNVETLNAKLTQQEQVTKIAKVALENAATAAEVDAKQVARLESEVNKSLIAEGKLKVELVGVSEQLGKATNAALQHGIAQKEMGEKAEAAGKKISGVGDNMTKYLTVPVLAAAAALAALAVKTIASADTIQLAADKYGLTTDRVQELTYAGKGLDVEFDVMASSQSKLIKAMTAANNGTKAQKDAFDTLGISVVNSDGSLRDSNVVWGEVIDKLGQMPNQTEASSIAMILLGKSAMDLNPLIRAGSGELAKYTEEAHKNGAVMSGESVAALDKFGKSIEMAKVAVGTAAGEITVKMLPTLNKLLPIVQKDIVPAIGKFAEGVGDLIAGFNNLDPITKGVVTTLAGLLVVAGPVVKMVGMGITMFGTMKTAAGVHAISIAMATTATEGLTAAEGVATVGATGLAAALGPISIAVGLIAVAYAAAGIVAANTMSDATKESKAFLDETNNIIASCDSATTAFKNQSAEIDTNVAVTQELSNKLFALSDKEKKSNTEKAQMKSLVSQLNTLMPDLNLTIDEQTSALNKNQGAIDACIKSEMAKLKLQANEDYWTELYKEQLDLNNQLTAAEKKHKAAIEGMATDWDGNANAAHNSQVAIDELTVSLAEVNVKLGEQETAIGQSGAATIPYVDSILGTGKVVEETSAKIVDATGQTAAELEAQAAAVEKSAEDQQKIVEQYYTDLEQSAKDHEAEMGSVETFGIERSKLTAKQLKKNRDQQVKDYQDWRAGLKEVAKLVPADVLAELEKLGPSYDGVIDDLINNFTPEQIAAFVESMRAPAREGAKAAEEEMGKVPEAAAGAVINTTAEFQKTALLEAAAREAGRKTTAAYLAGLKDTPAGSKSDYFARMTAAFAAGKIPAYDVGTHYVPYDQLALIHKGEAVIPADENPFNPARSLGTEATNQAMANRAASSSVINNATTDASVSVSLSGAVFNVRSQSDIDAIATQLAAKVAASRKAVGA